MPQFKWPWPILTFLYSRRLTPTVPVAPPPEETTPEIAAGAEVPSTTSAAGTPAEPKKEPVYKGSETSAAGVKFDIYYDPNTGTFDAVCPEHPFYDRKGEFRSMEDAIWYIEEVSMGSKAAVVAAQVEHPPGWDPASRSPSQRSTSPYRRT